MPTPRHRQLDRPIRKDFAVVLVWNFIEGKSRGRGRRQGSPPPCHGLFLITNHSPDLLPNGINRTDRSHMLWVGRQGIDYSENTRLSFHHPWQF